MKPIEYVTSLNQTYQSQGFPPYKWSEFESSPWTPFSKPLNEARVAVISSAGVFKKDQDPFNPWAVNDLSFRQIPTDTAFDDLNLHHNYFDHRDAIKDLNCVFPIQRFKELEKAGHIGLLVPVTITLGMGRLYKRTALQNETVPGIVDILQKQNTDAVFLIAA